MSAVIRTASDEKNDAERLLAQATGLVDLLSEFAAPDGDLKQGATNLDALSQETLHTTLYTLSELLARASRHVGAINAAKLEVQS